MNTSYSSRHSPFRARFRHAQRALKSPKSRVNVASAGRTTSARPVCRTLFEINATGKATTNNAVPTTVAAKQSGRPTKISAATFSGLTSSARTDGPCAAKSTVTQLKIISRFFIWIIPLVRSCAQDCWKKINRATLNGIHRSLNCAPFASLTLRGASTYCRLMVKARFSAGLTHA